MTVRRFILGAVALMMVQATARASLDDYTYARRSLIGALGLRPNQQELQARQAISDSATVRLRAAGWFTQLDGRGEFGEPIPGSTTTIDLIDTLGLDEDKVALHLSGGLNLGREGRWHVDAGYNGPFDYDGSSGNVDLSFNDYRFTGVVDSDINLNIYSIGVSYDIVKAYPFTLTLGPGCRVFDLEAKIRGTATDPNTNVTSFRQESIDAIVPLPGLGLAARMDLTPELFIKVIGQGIYAGDYGNFFDASAEVGYNLGRNVGVFGGYRWMHAEADTNDVDFEVDLDGFYAGLEIRF